MAALTENERRILDRLSKESPLSKRDITVRCGMGWATAVKLMTRLEEQRYIVPFGTERQNQAGKTATVYTLSPLKPSAIGIDVEYARTRVNIRNLVGDCMFKTEQATPRTASPAELTDYLETLLSEATREAASRGISLVGAGIGVPSHLFGNIGVPYWAIAETLSTRVGMPVTVDNNIRCFTAGIVSAADTQGFMLVVTVRSGIGVGIVLDGQIYQGERGCSGEIGHTPVDPNGRRCRCGKIGCLETIANRDALAADLKAASLGDEDAERRAQHAARMLGNAIASMMLVLDVRNVALYADLGDLGEKLTATVRDGAAAAMYPGFEFQIGYSPLDSEAYVVGATRLVLNQYIT